MCPPPLSIKAYVPERHAVSPDEQTISPSCHSGGPANSSSICRWRLIQPATFERKQELLELLDVKVRLYERGREPRWVAEAWLPVYREGTSDPIWVRETVQDTWKLWSVSRTQTGPAARPG